MSLGGFSGSDAGVKNHWLAPAVNRAAAGPDFGFTRFQRGCECDGQGFPFGQIAALYVPPIFGAAAIAEGMQLIEEVVPAAMINWAVRIVDPLGGGGDVEN